MSKSTILLVLFACLCLSEALKVNHCRKRTAATIESVAVSGCTEFPCILKKDSNPAIEMSFKMKRRVNDLKLKIAGRINGREIPFSVDDTNHCKTSVEGITNRCSLSKNTSYNYKFSLPILKEYPSLMVVVKYELVDLKGRSVACFTFPAKIEE